MDTKTVVVNFQYITAFDALKNILEQCGKSSVLLAIDEIGVDDDENYPVSLINPIRTPESTCDCSWDYVTGESPNYYCGKCGRYMSR